MGWSDLQRGSHRAGKTCLSELDVGEMERFAGRMWALMENGPVAVMLKDREGRCLYGNSLFEKIIGTSDWLGRHESELFPPEKAKRLKAASAETLRTGKPTAIVLPCVFQGASTQWWKVVVFPVACPDGETLLGVNAQDVTDQRRVEEEVLDISDREQRRMARELHDGLCQHLVGLRMMSQSLQDALERENSPHKEKIRSITAFLDGGVELARELIRDYHLLNIEEKGLVPALEEFAGSTGQLFGVPVSVSVREPVAIPRKDVAMQLFRIAQEAVHNALKHADPGKVDISIDVRNGSMVMEIRDNGRGFPPHDELTRGLGLNSMHYRADVIDGELHIISGEGKGTVIRCLVPLESLCAALGK